MSGIKVGDIITMDGWLPERLRWWQIFKKQTYKTRRHKVTMICTDFAHKDTE